MGPTRPCRHGRVNGRRCPIRHRQWRVDGDRAEYLELMQRLHGANGPFRVSIRETPEMYVRFLAPDVAMADCRSAEYRRAPRPAALKIAPQRTYNFNSTSTPARAPPAPAPARSSNC